MPRATLADLPAPPPGKSGWPWTEATPPLPATPPGGGAWPRVSIVTPSFNDAEFLEESLRSVLLQGYPSLEYIVIDGGSSDGSVEIIKRYAPWLARWTSEVDGGLAFGLNKGFAQASGEVMGWINSSDKYHPGALRVVAEVMTLFPDSQWLTTTIPTISDVDGKMQTFEVAGFSRRFFALGGNSTFMYATALVQQESTFWRRSLWEKAGGRIDESYRAAVDFELWWRFFQYAPPTSVEAKLGCFRLHPGQLSRRSAALYREESLRALRRTSPSWLEQPARLYKRLALGRFVRWKYVVRLLYGEHIMAVVPHAERGWTTEQRWVA